MEATPLQRLFVETCLKAIFEVPELKLLLNVRGAGKTHAIKLLEEALNRYPEIKNAVEKAKNGQFECPSCGKDWDTTMHSDCSCGATIATSINNFKKFPAMPKCENCPSCKAFCFDVQSGKCLSCGHKAPWNMEKHQEFCRTLPNCRHGKGWVPAGDIYSASHVQ